MDTNPRILEDFKAYRLSKEFTSYEKAKFVILPVMYEGTVSYKKGTFYAPKKIMDAFLNLELYDEELGISAYKLGIYLEDPLIFDSKEKPEIVIEKTQQRVSKILTHGKLPVILGGEHSITIGCVKAMLKRYKNLSILILDAHADLRDEFMKSRYNHACTSARIRELSSEVVQVGIRSMSRKEGERLKKEKLDLYFAKDFLENKETVVKEILSKLQKDVYVSIDVDVFDSSILPAVGTPEPGGLDWYSVLFLLKELSKRKKIRGFDLVEFSPIAKFHAYDFMLAKLMYKFLGYISVFNYQTSI